MKTHAEIQDGILAAKSLDNWSEIRERRRELPWRPDMTNWFISLYAYDDNGCYEIDKDLHAQKAEVERMGYHFFRVNAVKAEAA